MIPERSLTDSDFANNQLQTGSEIHLTLFDPRLPELFNHVRGPLVGGSQSCRCSVEVQRQDEDGLLVRLPQCRDARACFCPGRALHGACETPVGRMGFDVEVMEPAEGDGVGPSTAKLSIPTDVRNANQRATYRVMLAPRHRCPVPVCMKPSREAWETLCAACVCNVRAADSPMDSEPEMGLPLERFVEVMLTDLSLGGVGLAARESPEFVEDIVGKTLLLGLALPGLCGAIPCRVEVCWFRRLGLRVVRFGGRFDTAGDRATAGRLEEELGAWVLERQRDELRKVCR